jgi:hypothetical protein
MRSIALLLLSIAAPIFSNSQNVDFYTKDSMYLASVKKMLFTLDTARTCTLPLKLPFKTIRVEDVRFDTSQITINTFLKNIGVFSGVESYKVTTESATGGSLAAYFNHYYANNTSKATDAALVCFLKKLTCSRKDTILDDNYSKSTFGIIKIEAEVFLYTGNKYYAAFKIDTTLMNWLSVKRKEFALAMRDLLLMPALAAFTRKIERADWDITGKKKAFSSEEVYKYYREDRFKIPILYEPYKKGLYKTYAAFTNNTPSITGIIIEAGKNNTIRLKDSSGNKLDSIGRFGYCDGKVCWFLYRGYYHPLIRTGNCFYFFITIGRVRIMEVFDFDDKKQ